MVRRCSLQEHFHPGEYFYHKGMTRRGPFPSVRALAGARGALQEHFPRKGMTCRPLAALFDE
ncbi:MAG: hypothetical protein BRD44_02000 [Bacteroidetes bacterium QS_7_67_15]|nr:MAG: hypothetical protein BRD44_02000 [Bacteroidetes bacterium QS_7_67_15]